ncbi:MAG: NAD(P)/FAD-dependent oxidoreductase, partial [Aquincola sp.]|nr:NAD(P)/FAD-dependent oxidoreductase [Aquincola sp.]
MWDAIVIGSGIGGLAAAAALGRHGKRVLVLEQHTTPGGQTQTFQRGDWVFATGVHYIGGVGPQQGAEGQFGRLLAWLSDGALCFAPIANPYDIVQWPGFEFGIEHPEGAYRDALRRRFPRQRGTIDAWFAACEQARKSAFTLFALHAMPSWLAFGLRLVRGAQAEQWARHTLADELALVEDPALRCVLGARWGDYGAPPSQAPFVEHALVTGAYNAGAYYPVGGPARFAQTLRPAIEAAGGELRTGADVVRICMHDARASGVEIAQGGQLVCEEASWVISDMGARNTADCLRDEPAAAAWRASVSQLEAGVGYVAMYLGFDGDIAAAGAGSANHWIYESEADLGRLWHAPADEDAPALFVSFPSLKDPTWSGPHTAEVLALVDSAAFAPWLNDAGARDAAKREEDYLAFKDWVGERLVAQFLRHFPAMKPMLRFHELATPLTQRRYVRTPAGAMYGLEMTGERLMSPALKLRTPVPGLLLAGQDVMGPGVQAAFMGGLMAAATVDARIWR